MAGIMGRPAPGRDRFYRKQSIILSVAPGAGAAAVVTGRRMTVRCAVPALRTVLAQAVGRQEHDMAMAHAAFGDDVVGKFLHVGATAFEHGNFHAAVVIEMHVQCRLGEIVPVMEVADQALGQIAGLVVVDVNERGDARPRSADLARRLLQTGAGVIIFADLKAPLAA